MLKLSLEHLSNVCVEATKHAKPEDIKILKQHGEVIETEFIKGVVLQNLPVTNDMPKEVQGKVLCLDEEFAALKQTLHSTIPTRFSRF